MSSRIEAALEALSDAVKERENAEKKIFGSVRRLRKLNVSWAIIGQQLGMSRQAAHERYRSTTR